jgi:hypothetical protein
MGNFLHQKKKINGTKTYHLGRWLILIISHKAIRSCKPLISIAFAMTKLP